MSYIEKYIQDTGFNIERIELAKYEEFVNVYKITNPIYQWATILKWKEFNDDDKFWKPIVDRLRLIFESEIGFDPSVVYNKDLLLNFIDSNNPLLTPEEKIENLLLYIRERSTYDGDYTLITYDDRNLLVDLKFINKQECLFYFKTALEKGYLKSQSHSDWSNYLALTSEGISKIIKIEQQKSSRYCFVAMAFDESLDVIYNNAIEPAIITTGFIPIRIDKIHIDSDKTINDEMIAGIKKSRFTVADFTYHKAGVYFEAGYALGRGQQVIYTCRFDEVENLHFDLRNYQHIIWKNVEDFNNKLINKIEAFIKD